MNELTGLSGVESFWVRSALLSAEVFVLVAATASACLKFSPPFRVYQSRPFAAVVALALFAWYGVLTVTSLLLFLVNDELQQALRPISGLGITYLLAVIGFVAVAYSPMVPVYLHSKKFEAHA